MGKESEMPEEIGVEVRGEYWELRELRLKRIET
jgi:hypothetical protein